MCQSVDDEGHDCSSFFEAYSFDDLSIGAKKYFMKSCAMRSLSTWRNKTQVPTGARFVNPEHKRAWQRYSPHFFSCPCPSA